MSNKQDRQGVRTPVDVERKYLLTLEKSFAEVLGIATDARSYAVKTNERLSEEVARIDVKIEETAEGIVLSVADTYATNESVESKINISRNEILSSVSGTYATQTNLATLEQTVNAQGATITQQATTISEQGVSLAALTTKVTNQVASISMVVDNNGVKAGAIISAINGYSAATINANMINLTSDAFVVQDSNKNQLLYAGKGQVQLAGWTVTKTQLYNLSGTKYTTGYCEEGFGMKTDTTITNKWKLAIGYMSETDWSLAPFRVKWDGSLYATRGEISGWTIGEFDIPSRFNSDGTLATTTTKKISGLWSGKCTVDLDGITADSEVYLLPHGVYAKSFVDKTGEGNITTYHYFCRWDGLVRAAMNS